MTVVDEVVSITSDYYLDETLDEDFDPPFSDSS